MVTRGCGVMHEPTRSTQRQCRAKAVWRSDSAPRHGSCGKMPPIFSQCAGVTTRPFCVPRGGRAGYVSRVTTGRASELSERRPRTMCVMMMWGEQSSKKNSTRELSRKAHRFDTGTKKNSSNLSLSHSTLA